MSPHVYQLTCVKPKSLPLSTSGRQRDSAHTMRSNSTGMRSFGQPAALQLAEIHGRLQVVIWPPEYEPIHHWMGP